MGGYTHPHEEAYLLDETTRTGKSRQEGVDILLRERREVVEEHQVLRARATDDAVN